MAAKKPRKRTVTPTPIVLPGSMVRMESPKSNRQQKTPKTVVVVGAADDVVGGFFNFLREHSVVALALGFVIATQIQAVARQLIASFIDPAFKLVFGQALSQRISTFHFHGRSADFGWGAFIYSVLDVLFVLITIYVIVKVFKLDKLENPKAKHVIKEDEFN